MNDFEVNFKHSDAETMITIRGEFQGPKAMDYEADFIREIGLAPKQVVFAMQAVPYMDSGALGVLIKCAKKAESLSKSITVQDPSERVLKLLILTKLDQYITIHKSEL